MLTPPPCPVTGEPAVRLVQWVNARLLVELWRIAGRVDVRPSFAGTTRFGLWESPTGLYFFDPMREGDHAFYSEFYRVLDRALGPSKLRRSVARLAGRPLRDAPTLREEMFMAARHVAEGDSVLDVGCGPEGSFRLVIPQARYRGLDPNFGADLPGSWATGENLPDHVRRHPGAYDAVTAFQVLEHVADPLGLLGDMARAARPGGTVMVGVPHVPSIHSRIPNYLINAVPHHLTWWTEAALRAAAARVGLVDVSVARAPWNRTDAVVYWMGRCSPVKCRDVHFRHAWSWHLSAAFGALAATVMKRIRPEPGLPPGDQGASLVLVARVPG